MQQFRLYRGKSGCFFVENITTKKQSSLRTRDKEEANRLASSKTKITYPHVVTKGSASVKIFRISNASHGGEGPDLHDLSISSVRIANTIKNGIKGEMPTIAKKYDDAQIAALVTYLRTLQ